MRAGYFDTRPAPVSPLPLALGAQLGYTVLAVDRPGYGLSAARLPGAWPWRTRHRYCGPRWPTSRRRGTPPGPGCSSSPTATAAARAGSRRRLVGDAVADAFIALIGLDISGLGNRLAVAPHQLPGPGGQGEWRKHRGALRLYPPDFRLGPALLSRSRRSRRHRPVVAGAVSGARRTGTGPVRFTFAEQEQWWRHDEEAVAELTRPFASAPVRVDRQPDAGHNVSLGWAARTSHLRVCGFLEGAASPTRRGSPAASACRGSLMNTGGAMQYVMLDHDPTPLRPPRQPLPPLPPLAPDPPAYLPQTAAGRPRPESPPWTVRPALLPGRIWTPLTSTYSGGPTELRRRVHPYAMALAVGEEARQLPCLLADSGPLGTGERPQRSDRHGVPAGVRARFRLHVPGRGDSAVDQDDPDAGDRQAPVGVVDDPGAVVVAEDRIVEGRQEPYGRRGFGIRARRVGQVQQFPAALVAEGDQLPAERGDRARQPASPDQARTSAVAAGPYAAR
ncbi:hypothetical protein SMICM17S_00187 [Streptomyces microflavus]